VQDSTFKLAIQKNIQYRNMPMEQTRFILENFSGPLELLVFLVQKQEIELVDLPLCRILEQFIQDFSQEKNISLSSCAHFISHFSQLIYLKSLALAPHEEAEAKLDDPTEQEDAAKSNFIEHLIEYCSFKQAAKTLSLKEEEQEMCYLRGKDSAIAEPQQVRILENISLEDFSKLFMEIYQKAEKKRDTIWEEKWRVRDKIHFLRERLKHSCITFTELFSFQLTREELITIFLAVLELMKNAEIELVKTTESNKLIFQSRVRQ
jgi:segregation and condensation protein A